MTSRFLIVALALASVFGAQAVAKTSSKKPVKTSTSSSKHHKKHMKKTATTITADLRA